MGKYLLVIGTVFANFFFVVVGDVDAFTAPCPIEEYGYSLSGKTVPSTTRGAILVGWDGESFELDALMVVEVETDREISIDIAESEERNRYEISFLDSLELQKT